MTKSGQGIWCPVIDRKPFDIWDRAALLSWLLHNGHIFWGLQSRAIFAILIDSQAKGVAAARSTSHRAFRRPLRYTASNYVLICGCIKENNRENEAPDAFLHSPNVNIKWPLRSKPPRGNDNAAAGRTVSV